MRGFDEAITDTSSLMCDPLLGSRPSNAPIVGLELYYSYKWKREDDADRLVGRRLAKYRWYVIPIVNMAAHGVGVTVTLASTGR